MVYLKEVVGKCWRRVMLGGGTRRRRGLVWSESWVRRIKQERRELGKIGPKLTRDRKPKRHSDCR